MLAALELVDNHDSVHSWNLMTPTPKKLSTPTPKGLNVACTTRKRRYTPVLPWSEAHTLDMFVENTVSVLSNMGYNPHKIAVLAWESLSTHEVNCETQMLDLVLTKLLESPERKRTLDFPNPIFPQFEAFLSAPCTPAAPFLESFDKEVGGSSFPPDTPRDFGGARLPNRHGDVKEEIFYDDLDWDCGRMSVFSQPDLHQKRRPETVPESTEEDPDLLRVMKGHNEKDEKLQHDLFADLASKYY